MTGGATGPTPLPLPDPPLADPAAGVVLRPWGAPPGEVAHDAAALAAAWADVEVARWTAVPEARDRAAAARWIVGEPERRARGLALDLVVAAPDDGGRQVLGEVGLAHLDLAGRAEIGFWVVPSARGRGLATAAVTLLARWALTPPGPGPGGSGGSGGSGGPDGRGLARRQVWARTAPGNDRAEAVLARAGFARRGRAAACTVWGLRAASLPP